MDNSHQHHDHPHQVPDGATIPDGADVVALHPKFPPVPFEWLGLDTEGRSRLSEFGWTFWSTEPIGPTVPKYTLGEIRLAPDGSKYLCASLVDSGSRFRWMASARDGRTCTWLLDDDVADWPLARLAPNGREVMDECDKADRVTEGGELVEWVAQYEVWRVRAKLGTSYFGTLAALAAPGWGVTLSFADESASR